MMVQAQVIRGHGDTGAPRRPLVAGVFGNFVEWYDFAIYGYLAVALSKNFFPGEGVGPILSTLAVFAVAFVFRPLGGLVLGSLGDKVGRRSILALVVVGSSVATTAIGLLPTFTQAGWIAPALLIVLRAAQGFAAGGEYAGASSFIFEYAPADRRGLVGGALALSTYAAFLVGSVVAFGIGGALSDQAMLSWGWRIPFLVAAPLGLVGLYLRLKVDETPEFREVLKESAVERAPLRQALASQRRKIILLLGFLATNAVGPYLLITYVPTYLKTDMGFSDGQSLAALSGALVLICALLPAFGALSDRIGRKPVMLTSTILYVVAPLPAFLLLGIPSSVAAFGGMALLVIGQAASISVTAVVLSEMFPTNVRYSSGSFSYNIASMIFGGTSPLIAAALVAATGTPLAPAVYVMVVAAVSTVFVLFLPETHSAKRQDR
jgi:MFS transporter, MHS family, proline/betaine transporter